MTAKSRVRPHLFVADPAVPPGQDGRGACATCHLIGEAGVGRKSAHVIHKTVHWSGRVVHRMSQRRLDLASK